MYRIPAPVQSADLVNSIYKDRVVAVLSAEMNVRWTLPLIGATALGTAILAGPQAQELPPEVSKYLSKQSIVRAFVRLGSTGPERWFVAYDQHEQGRVALIEGDALTDDKAFETRRTFGNKLSLQSVKPISVPNAQASFLLSFEQEANRDTKYFSVVAFSPGALDIKLFVSAVGGKAEILDNPFRVRIWEEFREPNSGPNQYKVAEYRLLNINATKLAKVQEDTKTAK